MSQPAVRAEGIGKYYRLGQRVRYRTLRDTLTDAVRAPFRKAQTAIAFNDAQNERGFWALADVSFEIQQGDVVGIIGRNGAGKSTLLKILSRITEPTKGRAAIHGRVGSLLEVGTGFHPELSGRENIFLNGAIIGMRRSEITRMFDAIVAFAEVEPFIDTPIKHYSSGMYLRLAFAVAAHLDPEILLVDEVLAVGDVAFQKKCLGKMTEVATAGRTVLFVSHNLGVVTNLCSRGILLDHGHVIADGGARETVTRYIESGASAEGERQWDEATAPQSANVRINAVRIISKGRTTGEISIDEPFEVQMDFEALRPGLELSTSLHLTHAIGGDVLSTANFPSATIERDEWFGREFPKGVFRATCTFPKNFLNEGAYAINLVVLNRVSQLEVIERDAIRIHTHDEGAMRREWGGGWIGVVRPRLAWRTEMLNATGNSGQPATVPDVSVSA
jgi:homopolymeric O-antigen transport system ATP-binding protein